MVHENPSRIGVADAATAHRFYDTRGRLTRYAFGCGYIERHAGVTLWQEHGVYHARVEGWAGDPAKWRSARTLRGARRLAAMLRRTYPQRFED